MRQPWAQQRYAQNLIGAPGARERCKMWRRALGLLVVWHTGILRRQLEIEKVIARMQPLLEGAHAHRADVRHHAGRTQQRLVVAPQDLQLHARLRRERLVRFWSNRAVATGHAHVPAGAETWILSRKPLAGAGRDISSRELPGMAGSPADPLCDRADQLARHHTKCGMPPGIGQGNLHIVGGDV